MDFLSKYKSDLKKADFSSLTIKNYSSDIRKFILWYEAKYAVSFNPSSIEQSIIELFVSESEGKVSRRSISRYISSLKGFFKYLEREKLIPSIPFETKPIEAKVEDIWNLTGFKDYLYESNCSKLTIKNYLSDIRSYKDWAEKTFEVETYIVKPRKVEDYLNFNHIEEYKNRLIHILHLSPRTVNRKLSSVRKYVRYAQNQGFIGPIVRISSEIGNQTISLQDIKTSEQEAKSYSAFPPIRLLQRLIFPFEILTDTIAQLIAYILSKANFLRSWDADKLVKGEGVKNIEKEFYAPYDISTSSYPWYRKMLYHLKYTRPNWYKAYHKSSIIHYIHFAVLIIVAVGIGYAIFQSYFKSTSNERILGASFAPSRLLSFEGRLTDFENNPITRESDVRFGIYSDITASGSALLWEEVLQVKPDGNGLFRVLLGSDNPISESIFSANLGLFLGITIGRGDELSPRQRIAQASYAMEAETLLGMSPITQSGVGTTNVILALDSSGNLTIGGAVDSTFQVTGGQFKLAGKTLLLSSTAGSSGDIILQPDGFGKIDLQKAIVNNSSNGTFEGAVEIADQVFVNATSSANAVFIINNDGSGNLFSASSSGITKVVIDNSGFLGINTATPSYHLDVAGDLRVSGETVFGNNSYIWPKTYGQAGSVLSGDAIGTLSWTPIASISGSPFVISSGAVSASNNTVDFLLGGQSTDSAKFAVFNINSGTPTASLSAGGIGGIFLSATGTITTTNNQTITIGGSSSGNILLSGGNVGINVTNPSFKFELADSQAATVTAMLTNTSTSADADVLALKLGVSSVGSNNRFVTFLAGDGTIVGSIQGNGGNGVAYATSGIDFAEYYPKQNAYESFEAGDLVCMGINGGVTRCSSSFDKIIGVVSSEAGFIGGISHENDPSYVLVGIVGQLGVRVEEDSGIIKASDPLTLSSRTPGAVKKASSEGFIVGFSLQDFDPQAAYGSKGKVQVSVSPTWYDPYVFLSSAGDLVFEAKTDSEEFKRKTSYTLKDSFGNIIDRLGVYSEILVSNIDAGAIKAKDATVERLVVGSSTMRELTTNVLNVTSDSVTIDGFKLKDYIAQAASEISNFKFQISNFQSPLASIDEIRTNVISPLSSSSLSLSFDEDGLRLNDREGNTQVLIDSSGSAHFAGDIEAANASISGKLATDEFQTNSASVSGILYADTIVANSIDGLDEKLSSYAESFLEKNNDDPLKALAELSADFIDISTFSAQIALVRDGFISLGTSTFREGSFYDSLAVGSNFIISNSSINVIGDDLHIQSYRQGGVSFLSGLVVIDPSGNLKVAGNATFAKDVEVGGILSSSIYSPLADHDFVVQLQPNPSEFIIQNSSGSAILKVSQEGKIEASGSGSFAKLNLNLVSQALAVNDIEAIASGSAGAAVIKANKSEVTIRNPEVTSSSLIYITPSGNTGGAVLYLMRQLSATSFTVGVNNRKPFDIPFNWIIVN